MANDEGNRKIVVLLRVKIKARLEEEYERRLGEVYELAAKSPGLQSLKGYAEPGGEKAYIIEWDSEESFNRWWSHPAHEKGTQGGSGESLTPGYGVQVCREPEHRGRMPHEALSEGVFRSTLELTRA